MYTSRRRRKRQSHVEFNTIGYVRGLSYTFQPKRRNRPRGNNSMNAEVVSWTRQADGSYASTGSLPAGIPTARIFVIDEDRVECQGTKLWLKEEAVALVVRKIAEGSYKAWRYEVRPETSTVPDFADHTQTALAESSDARLCANPRCKRGQDGVRSVVGCSGAKYCCATCRVDVCRRNRRQANADVMVKVTRKPRSDRQHESHAARQRAYYQRKRTQSLAGGRLLGLGAI